MEIVFFNNMKQADDYYPLEGQAFDIGKKSLVCSPFSKYKDTCGRFQKVFVPADNIKRKYAEWLNAVMEKKPEVKELFDDIYKAYTTHDRIYLGIDSDDTDEDGYWRVFGNMLQRRFVLSRIAAFKKEKSNAS